MGSYALWVLYVAPPVSIRFECAYRGLRYYVGGDRPSQTHHVSWSAMSLI